MKEITEKLASIAWAMSNAAKDIESSKNLLRNLTHDFETVKHEIDKLQASSVKLAKYEEKERYNVKQGKADA
jgi:hypothetical protein